jgi:chromosome segregation ATPase
MNNIIEQNQNMISKLKFDKKNLEQKLIENKKAHENEIKQLLNYKNSELSSYQNIIEQMQKNQKVNLDISPKNNKLSLKNVKIQIEKLKAEISNKNKIINSLNNKISKFNEDYNNKLLQLQQNSNENVNQMQEQIEQLIIERDELLRKNENLTRGLMQFNDKVNEVNTIYNNKIEYFNKSVTNFKHRINQYKNQINILEAKNHELNNTINEIKNNGGQMTLDDLKNESNLYNRVSQNKGRKLLNNTNVWNYRNTPLTEKRGNVNKANKFYTYERNENFNLKNNNINNNSYEDVENQLDISQKQHLENYKSFLYGLDEQLI